MNDCAYCASGIYACSCERAHARGIAEGRAAERAEIVATLEERLDTSAAAAAWEQALDEIRCLVIARGEPTPKSQLLGIATPGREGSVSGATPVEYVSGELRIPMLEASVDRLPVINVAYLADQCHAARTGLSHVTSEEANAQMDRVLRGEVRIPMLATSAEDEAIVGKLVSEKTGAGKPMASEVVKSAAERITRDHRKLIEDLADQRRATHDGLAQVVASVNHSNMLTGAAALGALRVAFVEYLAWQNGTGDWDTFMSWIADERP